MKLLLKLFDKLLTNVLVALLLAFLSFSYLIGKFPPPPEDLRRAVELSKNLFFSVKDQRQMANTPQNPNIDQIVAVQRLSLQRSELVLELNRMMVNLPKSPPSPTAAVHLQRASDHLNQADQALEELNKELQRLTEQAVRQ